MPATNKIESQNMAPDHPSIVSITWKLLQMQSLRPHPRLIKPETLGVGPSNMCFISPQGI